MDFLYWLYGVFLFFLIWSGVSLLVTIAWACLVDACRYITIRHN